MKDNRTENLQATANTAEAETKEETINEIAAGPKKFKDVQALIDAYTALEAEFTRRSQRLKELEANKEQVAPAQAASAQALSQAETEGSGGVRALSQQEKNAVIEEYLSGVYSNKPVPFITVGGAVKAARVTPRTISEASSLAKRYFDNKEN